MWRLLRDFRKGLSFASKGYQVDTTGKNVEKTAGNQLTRKHFAPFKGGKWQNAPAGALQAVSVTGSMRPTPVPLVFLCVFPFLKSGGGILRALNGNAAVVAKAD